MTQLNHKPLRPQAQGTRGGRSHQAELACVLPGLRKPLIAQNWPFPLAELQGWICRAVLSVSEPDG